MGRSKLDRARHDAKYEAVKAAGKARGKESAEAGGADNAEASGMGGKEAAKKDTRKSGKPDLRSKEEKEQEKAERARAKEAKERQEQKEKEEKEAEQSKGAGKALRHAVRAAVRKDCTEFADSLMSHAKEGSVRSTEIMLSLMEKKKKDDEDDMEWNGLGMAEKLTLEPRWNEEMAKEKRAKEKEKETAAA